MKEKNILITVSALDIGGVEMRTVETICYLNKKNLGCKIYIYVMSGRYGVLDSEAKAHGAEIIYSNDGWFSRLLGLAHVIKEKKIDVVHVNASYASGMINVVAFLAGAKVRVSHIRSADLPEMPRWKKSKYFLYLIFLRVFSTQVVGVTAAAQKVAKVPRTKWLTLYDGLQWPEYEKEAGFAGGAITISVIGRMHECKNLALAARVVCELAAQRELPVYVKFIGIEQPAIKSAVERIFEEFGYEHYFFLGPLCHKDAMCELASSDLLLLTSTREGLPGVCLEAIATGVPVVASKLPGVLELEQYLLGISTVDLSEPPSAWCNVILQSLQGENTPDDMRRSFENSPFTIESHVETLRHIWGLR